jgi:tetratricopeptide (TPR) repeat protein
VSRALAYYLSTVRRAVDVLRPNQRRETYPGFDEGRARVSMATPADAVCWLEHEWPSLLTVAHQAADGPPEHARFVFGLTASTSQYLPMRRQWADIAALGSLHRRVAVRLGDRAAELTALVMLASVHRERGEYDHALRHLHEVLAARRAAADELGAAAAVAHLGLTLARRGDLSEALRCFEESASSYRAAGRLPAVGIARYEAAEVLLQLGCNDQALDYFTESLHIRRGERDLVGEGITLTGLGKAYVRMGRPGDAVRLLTESLERCRETGNRDYVWQALLWRAEAYRRTGDLDHAVADLRAALEVCRDSGHRLGQAYVLRLLSAVWRDQGERRRAAGCRRRAAAALAAEPLPAGPVAPDDDWPSGRRHAPAPSDVPRPGGAAPGSPGTPPARSKPGPGPAPAGAR